MYTLNNIVDLFRSFAATHGQINSFQFDPEYRRETSEEMNHPFMHCDILSSSVSTLKENNIAIEENEFEFRFLDLVAPDDSNELEVLSDCLRMAVDFIAYLRQTRFENGFTAETSTTMEPVRYVAPSNSAGWILKIKTKQGLDLDLCGIPGYE